MMIAVHHKGTEGSNPSTSADESALDRGYRDRGGSVYRESIAALVIGARPTDFTGPPAGA
jgi:hypothetical protein